MATKTVAAIKPDLEVLAGIAGSFLRWCVWRYQARDGGKPAKVPHNGKKSISTAKPDDWLSFDEARTLYEGGGFDGVGVLIAGNDVDVVAFDVDGCLDENGNVIASPDAVAALVAMGTYIEISPSGRGLRAFARGLSLDDCKEKVGDIEVYGSLDSVRYVTVTGHPWGECRPIAADPGAIESFQQTFGFWQGHGGTGTSADGGGYQGGGGDWPPISDAELLAHLKRNNKRGVITRLLAGDITGHPGDSEARGSLIGHMAYYSRDVGQIDRLMRGSGLMKPKLDEMRGAEKFSVWEVRRVLAGIDKTGGGSYWVDKAEREAAKTNEAAAKNEFLAKASDCLIGGLEGIVGHKGQILVNQYALTELVNRDKNLLGAMYYDLYSMMPIKTAAFSQISGDSVIDERGEVPTDRDYRRFEDFYGRKWKIGLKPGQSRQLLLSWADRTPINPVTDRLDKYANDWDGIGRLAGWLMTYGGADPGNEEGMRAYLEWVGVAVFLQVVARAYGPGAKADCMLILESIRQGMIKSSATRVMGESLSPRAFMEGFSLNNLSKDTLISLRGRAIIEFGELSGMNKHDANGLKNFLSARFDSYRDIYGSATTDWPRTAVMIGTTNEKHYLIDPTGGRRYWPVTVGKFDLKALERDIGQLWGEAVHLFRQGRRWWLDEDGEEDAVVRSVQRREVLKRMNPDTWTEMIEEFNIRLVLGQVRMVAHPDAVADPVMGFRLVELMALVFDDGIKARRTVPEEIRFRSALVRAGWAHNGSEKHGRWQLSAAARADAQRAAG